MDNELILKNRLKDHRSARGWSQSRLAEEAGVSRNTISSIETLEYCPSAKLAKILCIVLECDFDDLFYFDE
ncbi:MAG: helix-turn-helix transcriptional regulator [Lachnospiraceae bacterium]|nr:helix-turn-helix transcriptional regulator [Lachnospiraceae bacterium]